KGNTCSADRTRTIEFDSDRQDLKRADLRTIGFETQNSLFHSK
ncbi:5136_t:CDS:1, partial [Funneliformis geosporum]